MLIVGINGSPNKKGNTAFLLEKVMESAKAMGADETIIYNAGELLKTVKTPFCVVCSNPCSGQCYKDSALEEAFLKIAKADALVVGSPSYFGTVSGQLKCFFDKTRRLRGEKVLYNKVGAGVTVGATKYGGQETTMRAIHDMLIIQGMLVVGDGFIQDDCGHSGVSGQRPAQDDLYAIKRAEILGKRLVELANRK